MKAGIYKFIWGNVPWYFKALITIIVSAFIANYLLPSLFNWSPPVLPDGFIPSLVVTTGLILISFLIGAFRSTSKLLHEQSKNQHKKPRTIVTEQKKQLPTFFELEFKTQ